MAIKNLSDSKTYLECLCWPFFSWRYTKLFRLNFRSFNDFYGFFKFHYPYAKSSVHSKIIVSMAWLFHSVFCLSADSRLLVCLLVFSCSLPTANVSFKTLSNKKTIEMYLRQKICCGTPSPEQIQGDRRHYMWDGNKEMNEKRSEWETKTERVSGWEMVKFPFELVIIITIISVDLVFLKTSCCRRVKPFFFFVSSFLWLSDPLLLFLSEQTSCKRLFGCNSNQIFSNWNNVIW